MCTQNIKFSILTYVCILYTPTPICITLVSLCLPQCDLMHLLVSNFVPIGPSLRSLGAPMHLFVHLVYPCAPYFALLHNPCAPLQPLILSVHRLHPCTHLAPTVCPHSASLQSDWLKVSLV